MRNTFEDQHPLIRPLMPCASAQPDAEPFDLLVGLAVAKQWALCSPVRSPLNSAFGEYLQTIGNTQPVAGVFHSRAAIIYQINGLRKTEPRNPLYCKCLRFRARAVHRAPQWILCIPLRSLMIRPCIPYILYQPVAQDRRAHV